ncbi:hypothetical protein GGR58DRAFT_514764 [Xylaria digitata]|nr:hypothetical protein GGR58DRAFT_514764 [Xylaria digitata]
MAVGTVWGRRTNAALLLTVLLFVTSSSASITYQFQNFYPQHGDKYEYILHHNCSQQYANYLTGRPQDFEIDWLGGGGEKTVLVQPVVMCLLENVSEYIKSAASAAQVILGVTPPILATLGASTDELAMLSVVGRRPLLALLISFANPSVYMERVFDYCQPANILQGTRGRYQLKESSFTFKKPWLVSALQYVIALAAAVNIATISWQLGVGTVCSWWSETVFAPLVWTVLSIAIHMAGTFAIRLRVRRGESKEIMGLVPAVYGDEIRVTFFKEDELYVAWSWILSTATVIHILFGSLVLSGLLFIGPRDALVIIIRYVASVLLCRVLVTFELAGMRYRYVEDPENEKLDESS